jgi:small subunit ribosomal protein S24e
MEIEILSKKDNVLLERQEITFKAVHANEKTPKIVEVQEKLAGLLNTQKDRIVVNKMNAAFGKQETMGYAKVYPSKEALMALEKKHILGRNKYITIEKKVVEKKAPPPKKEAAPAAAAAPAKAEENKEAKKLEAKPEEKKETKKEDAKASEKKELKKEEPKKA